jgi:hypothetical protein
MMKFYFCHDDKNNVDLYFCRSLDIVAHETGHAVLDALKPKLYDIKKGQEGALHEAFADLTAVFAILSQFDMCEDIIADTKGNLRESEYLSSIGEQFVQPTEENEDHENVKGDSTELGEEHNSIRRGVRDISNNLLGSQCKDVYQMAELFSGYVYDILVECFEHERNPKLIDDAEVLFRVARRLRRVLLLAIHNTTEIPNFIDVSKAMEHAVDIVSIDDPIDTTFWKEVIKTKRVERELDQAGSTRRADIGGY